MKQATPHLTVLTIAVALSSPVLAQTGRSAQERPGPRAPTSIGATQGPSPDSHMQRVYVVNTFNTDPNHLYDPNMGGAISGPGTGVRIAWAAAFIPEKTLFAKTVTLALGHWSGTNAVRVTLRADADGLPGTVIRSAKLQDLPPAGCCSTVSFSLKTNDIGTPMLSAGTQYWIHVETTSAGIDTEVVWPLNNIGMTGRVARYYGSMLDAFDYTTFAFSVTGK